MRSPTRIGAIPPRAREPTDSILEPLVSVRVPRRHVGPPPTKKAIETSMKSAVWLALAVVLSSASCAEEQVEPAEQSGEQVGLGTISLNLTGVDTSGRPYRLRNAEFHVQSPYWGWDANAGSNVVLSTESQQAGDTLSATLIPGTYYVSLGGSWYIERTTSEGVVERVQKVVLLSEATQYAYVYQNYVTPIAFRFGVDGDLIDFRHGELSIDIDIEQPRDSRPYWGADAGYGAMDAGGYPY